MRTLFGTDGIRGEAGVPPLDAATVSKVGAALATSLGRPRISVVVGCDTRVSSESIVAALSGGLAANGATVRFAGVVPTPAVAWLTRELGADAGVSISASHNPWTDNGIKIFSAEGRKLPDAVETAIARRIAAASPTAPARNDAEPALARAYVTHLAGSLPHRLDGVKVVIDAAHGAAFEVAPAAFGAAGAEVLARNVAPDGRNINEGCGALHPEGMARAVIDTGASLGIALDGDADRIIVADDTGTLLDGDDVLYPLDARARARREETRSRRGDGHVELGAGARARGEGRSTDPRGRRRPVRRGGDGEVGRASRRRALRPSHPRGPHDDGRRHAHGPSHRLARRGLGPAALGAAPLRPHAAGAPEREGSREDAHSTAIPGFAARRRVAEQRLAGNGRLLLRYSGTEALARVMVEGADAALVDSVARDLVDALRESLGP